MNKLTKIAIALTVATTATMFAGCSKPSTTTGAETQKPTEVKVDPTKVSGEVNFAVYNWGVEDYTKLVGEFNKVYPNVKVNISGFEGDLNAYLTAQAASNTLPDVVFGWENLNFPISQGWVKPLNDFLAKDADIKNVEASLMNTYKFGGKTYAVPTTLQFNSILVNLDLVDQLNMDKPAYEWTIDQFKEYAKKATTDKYSAINHLWDFDDPMTGMFSKTLAQRGMDPATGKFNLTDGSWVKAISLHKELKAVPGLVSDDLKNQQLRDAGKEDDYMKKFGKDADALREGKVLFGFHGTWDLSWIRSMNYKYDMYPLPQDPAVGYRQTVHADHAFMTSKAKSPEAAFELLKWISYGKEGTLARINHYSSKVDKDGKATPEFFIPATSDEAVVKAFKALDIVPNGVKYMYDNKGKAFRADYYKVTPDYNKVIDEIVRPQSDQVREGKVEASAITAELEKKANAALDEARAKFDAQLKDVQSK
jgi:ABC-type glycerol-3-phosphate transport system substrate-binding protein